MVALAAEPGLLLGAGNARRGSSNKHAAIRDYMLNPDCSAEFNRKVKEGFVPIVSAVSGFVSYRAIEADDGRWTSISVFETRESADESVRLAADFVRQHLRPLIASGPDVIEGTVVISETSA